MVITMIVIGVAAGGMLVLQMKYGKKKSRVEAKIVDCIKYWDLFDYYKSPAIQDKLAANSKLRLFAQKEEKEIGGKQMYVITMAFFDSEQEDIVPLDNPLCLASEQLDDMLKEKFREKTILYMSDSIL